MVESESRILNLILPMVYPGNVSENALKVFCTGDVALVSEWVRFLFPEYKNNPAAIHFLEGFSQIVAASDRSLNEWLEQILVVYRWLDARGRFAKFSDVHEYASCAWHGDDTQGVASFLDNFGFERSVEKPPR